MKPEEIVGDFHIKGRNQEAGDFYSYEGTLHLILDENERFIAHWRIGDHVQKGTGFFKDDILVINFNYVGEDKATYKGVAVYRCLDANTLDGFWSEKHGDPRYLGAEKGKRIVVQKYIN